MVQERLEKMEVSNARLCSVLNPKLLEFITNYVAKHSPKGRRR